MATYLTPGVYIEEVSGGARPIERVGTSTAGFVGVPIGGSAPRDEPLAVNNWTEFQKLYVGDAGGPSSPLVKAVHGFFLNGGGRCYIAPIEESNAISGSRQGLELFESIDEIAIVAAPGYADAASYEALLSHCERLGDRVAILDPPESVDRIDRLTKVATASGASAASADDEGGGTSGGAGRGQGQGLRPRQSPGGFGAFYFPQVWIRDPLAPEETVACAPSGHLAGIWSRTDVTRGVHKAPANEPIRGALSVTYRLTKEEQGVLNPAGVNCIRFFAREGLRVWGARTVADAASEWRYLNVRRLFNMVEESIANSTRWVVFEPNDRTLWKSIRRDISAFLRMLWREGALAGAAPEEAFFVKCDEETNSQEVIDAGQVVTVVGIAPVKPAEFVIFRIGQSASGSEIASA